ncbi:radical SAM protein [Ligaoa zhengdingensis]
MNRGESNMSICNLCPRRCGVERAPSQGGAAGFCGVGRRPVVARAGLHAWEEPCISGTRGSGTVFFSGCNLRCCFCQNHEISAGGFGREIPVERLREIYRELASQGAHNINLVTPTHFIEAVAESLTPPPPVPVVYNSNGYERVESLRLLEGKVQIYLPDLKYANDPLALRYSNAKRYFETATAAIQEMYRQVGPWEMDEDGILQKGVVIRHLILPNHVENSFDVIDWVAGHFRRGKVLFSLMSQYIPCGRAAEYPEIDRPITQEERERVEQYLFYSGIEDGFVQEPESASSRYIPPFDLTGVEPARSQ